MGYLTDLAVGIRDRITGNGKPAGNQLYERVRADVHRAIESQWFDVDRRSLRDDRDLRGIIGNHQGSVELLLLTLQDEVLPKYGPGINLDREALERLRTVGECVDFVYAHVSPR